jgi:hypothetical protein
METTERIIHGQGSEASIRSDCLPLLSVATKHLFTANSFRILGLPVESTVREISRQSDKIKQMQQLGIESQGLSMAFPLRPPPTYDQVREAIQRLKDPEKRLLDEFFWFWPQEFGQGSSDPSIQALKAGDSHTAIQIWNIKESDPSDGVVAMHNLAVMWHMSALEFEGHLANSQADGDIRLKVGAHWNNAYKRWQRLTADDRFWDRLKGRVRQISDVRITSGFVYRIRRSLPEALFKINGELAVEYTEAGKLELARIQGRYIHEFGRGWADSQKVAELGLAPILIRLKEHIRLAKMRLSTKPVEGLDIAEELSTLAARSVTVFDPVCGPNSRFRNELFDDVADVCNKLVVAHFNKTLDAAACLPLFERFLPLATLESLRKQIGFNVTNMQQRLAAGKSKTSAQPSNAAGQPTAAASSQKNSQTKTSRTTKVAQESPGGTAARVLLKYFNDPSVKNLLRVLKDLKDRVQPPDKKLASAGDVLKKLDGALREISPEEDAYWDLAAAAVELLRAIYLEAIRTNEMQIAQYANQWAFHFAKTPDLRSWLTREKAIFQPRPTLRRWKQALQPDSLRHALVHTRPALIALYAGVFLLLIWFLRGCPGIIPKSP